MNLTIPNLTAEQVASIRDQVGIPTPPTPGWGNVSEYDGAFGRLWTPPVSKFNVVGVSQGGNMYPPPRPAWGTRPTYVSGGYHSAFVKEGDTFGSADWGTSREFHRITPFRGASWLVIDGYGPTDGSHFWANVCERCDWVNVDSGQVTDMTYGPSELQGQLYEPSAIRSNGHFQLRFWGTVGGGLFFWIGDFLYGNTYGNPAWLQGPPLVRQCREIREGWWNGGHTGGEGTGRATMTSPWDAADNPIVPTVTFNGFNIAARGAGTMWVYSFAPNVAGLESIE